LTPIERAEALFSLIYCLAEFNKNENISTVSNLADNADVTVDDVLKTVVPDLRSDPGQLTESKFENWLTHPVLFNHTSWTSTTTQSVVAKDIIAAFYASLATAAPAMASKLANFLYFRAKIKIQVVVQGSPAAAGQLVLAFTPRVYTPSFGTVYSVFGSGNIVNSKIVPHIIVDPSKTMSYELILPVCSPTGWYSFSSLYTHGSYMMEIFPFNSLFSGTSTEATVNVCTYMSFVEPEFQGMTLLLSSPFESEKKSGGTLSSLASTISKGADYASTIFPAVAPQLTLFSKVTGVVGSVLAWFGFSKPPAVENQVFITNRNCDNYSQKDGKSTSLVLGASQTQSLAISPAYIGGTLEDMSLDHLCSIPGPFSIGNVITAAAAAETLLATYKVYPTICAQYTVSSLPYQYPTPLAGASAPFTYWCGDITYRFEFVASVFNRATVLISYDPGYSTTSPTFAKCLNTLRNVTVNISGNTTIDFKIPWSQPMPVYRVPNLYNGSAANSGTVNGQVYVHLINPVQSNGSTDGIQYNVYSFSDNMALFCPQVNNISSYVTQTELLSAPFAGESLATNIPEFKSKLDDISLRVVGDRCRSVKDVVSRMNILSGATLTTGTAPGKVNITSGSPMPFPPVSVGTGGQYGTFFSWFWFAYLGYRGGTRLSFKTVAATAGNSYAPGAQSVSYALSTNAPIAFTQSQSTLAYFEVASGNYAFTEPQFGISSRCDVVVPMLAPVEFIPREMLAANSGKVAVTYVWAPLADSTSGTDTSDYTNVLIGAADDVTFGWFLGFQPVY